MSPRGKWQGMLTIARLNWPFYVAAVLVLNASIATIVFVPSTLARIACVVAIAGCLWFLLGSLAVSHLVYDRSDLYRWGWIDRALATAKQNRVVFCHAGFDEVSAALRQHLGADNWITLDHYDPRRMTEPSIRRARALFPPSPDTEAAPFHEWPVEADRADVVFGLLAIHELRSELERAAWFSEARRHLVDTGRVVVAEHVRNAANFLAFGPGFLHFHSTASWRRSWTRAGFVLHDEFSITPWVRIFVLRPA